MPEVEIHAVCNICSYPQLLGYVETMRAEGHGYKYIHRTLVEAGHSVARANVQYHCKAIPRDVMSGIGDAEDRGQEVDEDYLKERGIVVPDGVKWVAATVTELGANGKPNWVRIKPEDDEAANFEIRQAEPITITPPYAGHPTVVIPGNWETWLFSPDAQIGFWLHTNGSWVTTHDERCFDIGYQVAAAVGEDEGLDGWGDVGDVMDLQGISRHNPTAKDLHVTGFNMANQRTCQEWATRRSYVGEDGKLIVTGGNHDMRWLTKFGQDFPMLVGLRRAGDPEDEHPVLTVPYLTRAKDYGVEFGQSYPTGFYRLNSNLAAFHCPLYGNKALDTSRKMAARIHMSVIFGHTHRRESLAENIETAGGNRTLEIWSDGTWGRTDGALPSERNTMDDEGNRMLAGQTDEKWGMLSENWGQGLSVVHVEVDGRERFSVERIAIWDGWAMWRGQVLHAGCDANGIRADVAA